MKKDNAPSAWTEAHPAWGVAALVPLILGIVLLINGNSGWGFFSMFVGAVWIAFAAIGLRTKQNNSARK